jgi:cGMP-dependent protein kinase
LADDGPEPRDSATKRTHAVLKSEAPDVAPTSPASNRPDRDFEADRARLARARKKRLAVAVEALASDASIEAVPKDEATVRLIARAVRDNPLFEGLPDETRAVLVSSMTRVEVLAGEAIITQGDERATQFFVLESGSAVVRVKPDHGQTGTRATRGSSELEVNNASISSTDAHREDDDEDDGDDAGFVVATLRSGDAFGELALLYSCARAATVVASFDCRLWALDRDAYVSTKRAHERSARQKKRRLVDAVAALRVLDDASRAAVADALRPVSYDRDARVITKGEPGDRFFVVASGGLDVTDPDLRGDQKNVPLASLRQGDAFGERALMSADDVRQATVTVTSDHCELYYLERKEFDALLGSYGHVKRWLAFRNVPALASVSDEDLHEIARGIVEESFAEGVRVCAIGSEADAMYVVESGTVTVRAAAGFGDRPAGDTTRGALRDESEGSVVVKRPGEWFGERALMGAATTRAIEAIAGGNGETRDSVTKVYVLPRSVLESALGAGLAEVARRARLEQIGDVPFLRVLDARTRSALVDFLRPVRIEPGGVVFEQGDISHDVFFVESGTVVLSRRGENSPGDEADRAVLKTATRGDHFGELALLRGDPRAARAEASRSGAFLLALSRRDFDDVVDDTARRALEQTVRDAYAPRRGEDARRSAFFPEAFLFSSETKLSDFELKAVLGIGAFGKVYLAKHSGSRTVCAIKALSKIQLLDARLHKHVVQERDVMRDVADSKHTVTLLGTFQDVSKLYVCTEVVMGGELFNRLARVGGAISEGHAQFYTACVTLGLQYMQRKHYVYRDLKPENLLIDFTGYVKIADFGFAKRLPPGDRTYTLCGTPEYMAPELFKQTGHDKGVDWWAVGVLAYEMVLGSPPFYSPDGDGASQMRRVVAGKFAFPKGKHRPTAAFEDFVKRCLHPTSSKRLGCLRDGAADVKRHPWLAENVDWRGVAAGTVPAPWVPPVSKEPDACDVSCFDQYDLHCEHPGASFETAKTAKKYKKEDKVFAGF